MLRNLNNYYVYSNLIQHGKIVIPSQSINTATWRDHYDGILNIMKDGIETDFVQTLFITIDFGNEDIVDLSVPDYYLNLILWWPIISFGGPLQPQHLFFLENTTSNDIKRHIDKHFVEPKRLIIENKALNNAIADMLHCFVDIDSFSLYLANTLNLEDDIDLMNASPEYNKLIHCDLSNIPIEQVKDVGLEITHKAIDIIMNSKQIMGYEHCLKNAFAAKEGINIRQYKENNFNIGTKPDGQGSIYHEIINQAYITGGVNSLIYQIIDSGSSRVAQIISKRNVGESGGFSRILGLNNINSYLHQDPYFDCGTKNFIHIFIPNKDVLSILHDRYYRFNPNGIEYRISNKDTHLIGNYVYLRSPITCASNAEGHGVCYKCYGDLAFTNSDINIGRIATELITSQYTQKRLSAKHLLETLIRIINWCKDFYDYFDVDTNIVRLNPVLFSTMNLNGWSIIINPENIQLENDDEFFKHRFYSNDMHSTKDTGPFYNEYITEFDIMEPNGNTIKIYSIPDPDEDFSEAKMYISNEFGVIIRDCINKDREDDTEDIIVPMERLEDASLFLLKIQNNDLGKNLDIFNDLINKKAVTKSYTKDRLVEKLQETIINGGINCMSIHLEVIVSNQIRSIHNRLENPNWYNIDEKYEILTLNESLTDNQSVVISLVYQKLAKTLFYPLSFVKNGPSIFDPYFMRKPKKFFNADHEIWDEQNKAKIQPGESPIMFVHNHNGERPKNTKELIARHSNKPKTELDD